MDVEGWGGTGYGLEDGMMDEGMEYSQVEGVSLIVCDPDAVA